MPDTVTMAVAVVLTLFVAYLLFAEIGVPSGTDPAPDPDPTPSRPDIARYLNLAQATAVTLDTAVADWASSAMSLVEVIPTGEQLRDAAQHIAALPDGSDAAAAKPTAALADALISYRATTSYFAGMVVTWTPATASATLMSAKPVADSLPSALLSVTDRFAGTAAAVQNLHDAWANEYANTVVKDGCSGYECPPCKNGMKCVGAKRIYDAMDGTFSCIYGNCVPVMNVGMAGYMQTLAGAAAGADSEAAPSGDMMTKAVAAQHAYAGLFNYVAGV